MYIVLSSCSKNQLNLADSRKKTQRGKQTYCFVWYHIVLTAYLLLLLLLLLLLIYNGMVIFLYVKWNYMNGALSLGRKNVWHLIACVESPNHIADVQDTEKLTPSTSITLLLHFSWTFIPSKGMIWYGRERKMNEFNYNYDNPVRMKYILYL